MFLVGVSKVCGSGKGSSRARLWLHPLALQGSSREKLSLPALLDGLVDIISAVVTCSSFLCGFILFSLDGSGISRGHRTEHSSLCNHLL